jgi:hypothetical protein
MQHAWQLLLAHSLHAACSLLLALHDDNVGLLPAAAAALPPQQPSSEPAAAATAPRALQAHALFLLQILSAAVAWIGPQLTAMQQQAAGQADTALQEQQQSVHAALEQAIAAGNISSNSSSSSSWQDIMSILATDSSKALDLLLALKAAVPAQLAQELVDFGAALSGRLPCKLCCNAPGCSSLAKFSELEAVGGKACMCGRCKTARCGMLVRYIP